MKSLLYLSILLILFVISVPYLNADCGISKPIPVCYGAPVPEQPQLTTSEKANVWFHIFLPYYI